MIAAMAKGRVIGKEGGIPWHLPADFGWFRHNTLGKPVIIGRKTYESIGHRLQGRHNIVISRNPQWSAEGVDNVTTVGEALALVQGVQEAVVIGGSSIYALCLPLSDRLYLTHINADIDGDTRFPEWGDDWVNSYLEYYNADEKNQYSMEFIVLDRRFNTH